MQLYANIAYQLGRTFVYLQRSSIQNPITMEKQHVSSRQTVPNRANHSTFDWLVVWNMFNFPLIFHILGTIIPFDYYFSEGWNHQPVDISWNISHLPSTIWAPFFRSHAWPRDAWLLWPGRGRCTPSIACPKGTPNVKN